MCHRILPVLQPDLPTSKPGQNNTDCNGVTASTSRQRPCLGCLGRCHRPRDPGNVPCHPASHHLSPCPYTKARKQRSWKTAPDLAPSVTWCKVSHATPPLSNWWLCSPCTTLQTRSSPSIAADSGSHFRGLACCRSHLQANKQPPCSTQQKDKGRATMEPAPPMSSSLSDSLETEYEFVKSTR